MKKKNKHDPAQLLLDFSEAKDELQAALEKLGDTIKACVAGGAMTSKQAKKESSKINKGTALDLRDRINRVVREHARTKRLHWKEIFQVAYLRLWEATGFNAAARAIAAGGKTKKLDMVEEHGHLPGLLRIVAEL